MQSRTLALTFICALGACSSSPAADGDVADAKLAARATLESAMRDNQAGDAISAQPGSIPPSAGTRPAADVCKESAWYGDGECDAWCPDGDAKDCAPSSGGVACAAIFSPADGFCNRKDPCGPLQDEDCAKEVPPSDPGCAPDQPVPQPGDGKCEPKSLAELKADPDCATLVCPAIFSPADGVCNAKSACDYVIDEDCANPDGNGSSGVACIDIAYATNGKCEAAAGCEANDPVDCKHEVVCDARLYATNGRCEAPPGCEANDPKDCQEPVACITILYPKNGKCEAAKGCESSDPDC
jgi:hypothetical protein